MKDNDTQPEQLGQTPETQTNVRAQVGGGYRTEEVPIKPPTETAMQGQGGTTPGAPQQQGVTPESVLTGQAPVQGVDTSKIEDLSQPRKRGGILKRLGVIGTVVIMVVLILGGVIYKLQSGNIGNLIGKKGEIIWWGIMEEEAVVKPLIEQFEEENPNIKVTYNRQSEEDYRVRLTNSLAGG